MVNTLGFRFIFARVYVFSAMVSLFSSVFCVACFYGCSVFVVRTIKV